MRNGFIVTFLIGILMLGISSSCFAQKKKKPVKEISEIPATVFETDVDCNPVDQKALVIVSENGDLVLGGSKIEKTNFTNQLRSYICAKIPPEQIVFIKANPNILYSQVTEIMRLGRKIGVDDFGLKLTNTSDTEILIKVPELELPIPKKIRAHPLALIVSLDAEGKLKLNNKPETLDSLKQKLKQIFLTRKQKSIYIEGSKDIDKTVFVYVVGDSKFGDVLNLIKEIEKLEAYPIGLDVDDDFLKTIWVK